MLLKLFVSFFKIGLFTFGGGYAMLPLLEKEICDKHTWISHEELLNFYAISQATPGVIAINTASFIGYKQGKSIGAIVATVGVALPSVLILTFLTPLILSAKDNIAYKKVLLGINISVVALLFSAVIKMGMRGIEDRQSFFLFIVALLLVQVMGVSSIFTILLFALLGILFYKRKENS